MKKYLSLLLALAMLLSLGVTAFAQTGDRYTMHIERTEKVVYQGTGKASLEDSGKCNAALYELLNTDMHDRSLFASMTIDFEDVGEEYYKATKQTMVGNNGYTYENSNPQAVFLEPAGKFYASGAGESEIVVYAPDGTEADRFTVTVTGVKPKYIIKAVCSKCGEDMGTNMHIYSCGHFVCQDGGYPMAHAAGACGYGGHFVCDGKDHSYCSNCLSPKCYGEHGVGICQHVHNWFYAYSANYWPYWEPGCPMRICTSCGAREYAWWMLPRPSDKTETDSDKTEPDSGKTETEDKPSTGGTSTGGTTTGGTTTGGTTTGGDAGTGGAGGSTESSGE